MREGLVALVLALCLSAGGARAQPLPPMEAEAEIAAAKEELAAAAAANANTYLEVANTPESQLDEGLRITVSSSLLSPVRGFVPVQVLLHDTRGVARTVDLVVRTMSTPGTGATRRRVEVGARQEVSVWLPAPAPQAGFVDVSGPGLSSRTFSFYAVAHEEAVLALGARQEFEAGTGLAHSESDNRMAVRFVAPTQAPRELASYEGYSAVVVTGDVTALPADVWSALEAYSATGGLLVLLRPPRDVLTRLPLINTAVLQRQAHPHGFGWVRLCGEAASCGRALLERVVASSAQPDASVEPAMPRARDDSDEGLSPLLPGVRAPVGRFLLLLSLFVLVVGPGGLWLVRRKGQMDLVRIDSGGDRLWSPVERLRMGVGLNGAAAND